MVRRLTGGVTLSGYYGVLDEERAAELEAVVERRREKRSETHRDRIDDVVAELDERTWIRRS